MICIGCKKKPDEIEEYVEAAAEEEMSPDDYVVSEEGTYNSENDHLFLYTDCYIRAGEPSRPFPDKWVAP